MVGQIGGDRRQLLAVMAPSLEGEADGAGVRHVAIERLMMAACNSAAP